MGKLDGKVALITGGANGQGAAESRLFAGEGANVVVADIDDEPGKLLADELGDAAVYMRLDVTSEDEWEAAIRATHDTFGRLDVLINNAG
ncbi:MAG TPA: SDR family NAD(P)-dependent oxidoreductase, partial [Actinomycetota bacterium]